MYITLSVLNNACNWYMKLNICHHRILAFTRMFLCLTHNVINIALFVGSSDLYLEDEDDEFGKFNDKHECLATITCFHMYFLYATP